MQYNEIIIFFTKQQVLKKNDNIKKKNFNKNFQKLYADRYVPNAKKKPFLSFLKSELSANKSNTMVPSSEKL